MPYLAPLVSSRGRTSGFGESARSANSEIDAIFDATAGKPRLKEVLAGVKALMPVSRSRDLSKHLRYRLWRAFSPN